MNQVDEITELLYGPGEEMKGASFSNDEAIDYVLSQGGQFAYCLVRDWIWIDLEVGAAERALVEQAGKQPVIMYAPTVVFDSARRFDVGNFVRTSPLISFEEGFLFRTANTIYVLLGDGQRKKAALTTVARIF